MDKSIVYGFFLAHPDILLVCMFSYAMYSANDTRQIIHWWNQLWVNVTRCVSCLRTVVKVDQLYLRLVHVTDDCVGCVLKKQFQLLVVCFTHSVVNDRQRPLDALNSYTDTHTHTHTHKHFTALWTLSGTKRVSWYQRVHFAIFWIFWCKLKISQWDAPTIRMDCHTSRLMGAPICAIPTIRVEKEDTVFAIMRTSLTSGYL